MNDAAIQEAIQKIIEQLDAEEDDILTSGREFRALGGRDRVERLRAAGALLIQARNALETS